MLHHSFVCRILCYNAGIEDPQQLGRLEREYTDPTDARIFAIEYNPHSKHTQQVRNSCMTSQLHEQLQVATCSC